MTLYFFLLLFVVVVVVVISCSTRLDLSTSLDSRLNFTLF